MKKISAYFIFISCSCMFWSCNQSPQESEKETIKTTVSREAKRKNVSGNRKEKGLQLFNDSFVHTVKITLLQADAWDSLVYYKKLRDSIEITHYIQCNVVIDSTPVYAVGLRFKGESSYDYTKSKKKSFKVVLNRFTKGQDYDGIEKINLNNNFKDPTMMREKLVTDAYHRFHLPAPRASYAAVYLNNVYWGLYLMVEEIDKEFIAHNFMSSAGNLYQGEPDARLISFGDTINKYKRKYQKKNNFQAGDWNDLITFITSLNEKKQEEEYWKCMDTLLNTSQCLAAWAMNNLFMNIDAYNMCYTHNYFLYHNISTRKFEWISYDFNYGFAAWNPRFNLNEIQNFDILYVQDPPSKNPLAQKFLKENMHFQRVYLDRMKEITENYFLPETLFAQIDKIASMIRKSVYADSLKEYTNAQFEKNMNEDLGDVADPGAFTPGLKPFILARRQSVLDQLKKLSKENL